MRFSIDADLGEFKGVHGHFANFAICYLVLDGPHRVDPTMHPKTVCSTAIFTVLETPNFGY